LSEDMSAPVKRRGRPPKNKTPTVEQNQSTYEYNTSLGASWFQNMNFTDIQVCSLTDLAEYIKDPMRNNAQLRKAAWWAYRSDGSVQSAIEYMRSMHTLNGVVVCATRGRGGKRPSNFERNKDRMSSALRTVKYEQFIRDVILKNANDGTSFYYFETKAAAPDKTKFLSDIDVANIVEINELGINASIISLPIDYCKIVGRKNNFYVAAFDLRYFQQYSPDDLKRKLRSFPAEIRDAWATFNNGNAKASNWVVLDNTKTIVTKINSTMSDPWGVPIAICALDDVVYADYFTNTKRAVLDEINNQIIYETFPESDQKGKCALTETQQQKQHDLIKGAINTKLNASGRTFFSLAAGTKLDKLDANIDIFDEKNENGVKDAIPSALGIAASSLNGNTKGNYATATLNIELVASRVYSWIKDIFSELNKCINENIIQDKSCLVEFSVFPTTYVNREKFFNYMKSLYTDCSGSLLAVVAATGMDADAYMSLMDYEREQDFIMLYPPHQSMYTQSGSTGGRPSIESDNPRTVQTKTNGANSNPKPSTQ
jgi:hypothetical protein